MVMKVADKRVFTLIEILKGSGKLKFVKDFYGLLEMHKQNFYAIKRGTGHFTLEHIKIICDQYEVNANWILGLQNEKPFRVQQKLKQKLLK